MTASPDTAAAEAFEPHRRRLFGLAYRMLGTAGDAEDVVQETYLRFHAARAAGVSIASDAAFLTTVTTRLAIDHLKSARVRREAYVGEWLPEPLLTGGPGGPELVEELSLAFLVLLEGLTPQARAAFVLREVFEYPYPQIAEVLGMSEAACRQLVSRAKRDVGARRRRYEVSREVRDAVARRFYEACQAGDAAALERLLAEDVTFTGDGGGRSPAAARPVTGRPQVTAFVLGLLRIARRANAAIEPAEVNGRPGALVRDREGRLVSVLSFEVEGDAIAAFHSVVNPDKLRHLGPLAGPEFFRYDR